MSRVGFIGLGIMGKPMAKNLLKAGIDLMVCDLNEQAVKEVVECGAQASSYREIGEKCDIVFLILPNGDISKSVLFDEGGVAQTLTAGKVVCDMSSVTPVESKECFAFMAGGRQEDFDKLMPYYNIMGSSAVLIGDSGSGSVTKLANQIIVNNTIAIVSEAFVMATKAGADPVKVYEAIRGGLAGSAVLDAKIPMIVERNFVPGGKISINHKDIKNVVNTAHAIDVPIPYSAQLYEILQTLKIHGHMNDDHGGIVQYFEALADIQVKKKD